MDLIVTNILIAVMGMLLLLLVLSAVLLCVCVLTFMVRCAIIEIMSFIYYLIARRQ